MDREACFLEIEEVDDKIQFVKARIAALELSMNSDADNHEGTDVDVPRNWYEEADFEERLYEDKMAIFQEVMDAHEKAKDVKIVMKVEVSYKYHAHLIGVQGSAIREVLELTECKVHFPDTNRYSRDNKSNQVTITGEHLENVEEARSILRDRSPLGFRFLLPITHDKFALDTAFIRTLEVAYNVFVSTFVAADASQSVVIIKGWEADQADVITAIRRFLKYFANHLSTLIVESTMEIMDGQHAFVRSNHSIRSIMNSTGATVVFPDLYNRDLTRVERSHVSITGELHRVYLACQQLIGCLPLQFFFDVPDATMLDMHQVRQMCAEFGIKLKLLDRNDTYGGWTGGNIRLPPPVQGRSRTFFMTVAEKNTQRVFAARRIIMGGTEKLPYARIPSTYFLQPEIGLVPAPQPPPPPMPANVTPYQPQQLMCYQTMPMRSPGVTYSVLPDGSMGTGESCSEILYPPNISELPPHNYESIMSAMMPQNYMPYQPQPMQLYSAIPIRHPAYVLSMMPDGSMAPVPVGVPYQISYPSMMSDDSMVPNGQPYQQSHVPYYWNMNAPTEEEA